MIFKKIKKKLKITISTSKHLKKTIHVKKINEANLMILKKIKKKLKNTISASKHLQKTIHIKKINYTKYF